MEAIRDMGIALVICHAQRFFKALFNLLTRSSSKYSGRYRGGHTRCAPHKRPLMGFEPTTCITELYPIIPPLYRLSLQRSKSLSICHIIKTKANCKTNHSTYNNNFKILDFHFLLLFFYILLRT